eukprot:jgi/Chlat1/8786/Chrsp90S08115
MLVAACLSSKAAASQRPQLTKLFKSKDVTEWQNAQGKRLSSKAQDCPRACFCTCRSGSTGSQAQLLASRRLSASRVHSIPRLTIHVAACISSQAAGYEHPQWTKLSSSSDVTEWQNAQGKKLSTKVQECDRAFFWVPALGGPENMPWPVDKGMERFKKHLPRVIDSVGLLVAGDDRGTAVHLGNNLVLTNTHVAESSLRAQSLALQWGELQMTSSPISSRKARRLDLQSNGQNHQDCELKPDDVLFATHYGEGVLVDGKPVLQVSMVKVQHSASDDSASETQDVVTAPGLFRGSPGAPLFDSSGKLVGFHLTDESTIQNFGCHIALQRMQKLLQEASEIMNVQTLRQSKVTSTQPTLSDVTGNYTGKTRQKPGLEEKKIAAVSATMRFVESDWNAVQTRAYFSIPAKYVWICNMHTEDIHVAVVRDGHRRRISRVELNASATGGGGSIDIEASKYPLVVKTLTPYSIDQEGAEGCFPLWSWTTHPAIVTIFRGQETKAFVENDELPSGHRGEFWNKPNLREFDRKGNRVNRKPSGS